MSTITHTFKNRLYNIIFLSLLATLTTFAQRQTLVTSTPEETLDLVEFRAEASQKGIELTWIPHFCKYGDIFIIERANADGEFYILDRVTQTDPRNNGEFSFLDNAPEEKIHYYRISKQNGEGRTQTSYMIDVECPLIENIAFGPNPTIDILRITFKPTKGDFHETSLKILNQNGEIVFQQQQQITLETIQQFEVNMAKFNSGIYLIQLQQGNITNTRKVVKL